ncbi:MAG TPA: PadR family transcriptional regulator [Terriglobales bacterium]|nr:PadR family transcriptional regulator [Terriglobales bacterium]
MTTEKSTDFAILGMLTIKPMSGYEIRQVIGQNLAHFWSESYGQLYPSLKKLEAAGLVTKRTEPGQKRDKHIYTITSVGRERLREWLVIEPKPQPPRSELLLKLFFLSAESAPITAEHVARARAVAIEDLKHFGFLAEKLRHLHAGNPQLQQWLYTLSSSRQQAEAVVRWADETLASLQTSTI